MSLLLFLHIHLHHFLCLSFSAVDLRVVSNIIFEGRLSRTEVLVELVDPLDLFVFNRQHIHELVLQQSLYLHRCSHWMKLSSRLCHWRLGNWLRHLMLELRFRLEDYEFALGFIAGLTLVSFLGFDLHYGYFFAEQSSHVLFTARLYKHR